jgi:hypothetical protein
LRFPDETSEDIGKCPACKQHFRIPQPLPPQPPEPPAEKAPPTSAFRKPASLPRRG